MGFDEFTLNLLNRIDEGAYLVDPQRRITFWNKGAERITGFSAEEVVGSRCADNILNHVDGLGCRLCVEGCPLLAAAERREEADLSLFLHHKNGSRIPIRVQTIPLLDGKDTVWGFLELFSNLSEVKLERRKLDALHQELFIDPLTQLGNRRFCDREFARLLSGFNENREPFATALFDIDDFKRINDTYGHDFGDRILSMVASTLSGTLREDDIVCRWGGEEFLALLPGVQDGKELHSVLQRVLVMVRESFLTIRRNRVSVTISIGASVAEEGNDEDALFQRVDKLLYRSKRAGKDRLTIG